MFVVENSGVAVPRVCPIKGCDVTVIPLLAWSSYVPLYPLSLARSYSMIVPELTPSIVLSRSTADTTSSNVPSSLIS